MRHCEDGREAGSCLRGMRNCVGFLVWRPIHGEFYMPGGELARGASEFS